MLLENHLWLVNYRVLPSDPAGGWQIYALHTVTNTPGPKNFLKSFNSQLVSESKANFTNTLRTVLGTCDESHTSINYDCCNCTLLYYYYCHFLHEETQRDQIVCPRHSWEWTQAAWLQRLVLTTARYHFHNLRRSHFCSVMFNGPCWRRQCL